MTISTRIVDAHEVMPFSCAGDEGIYESQAVITLDGVGSQDLLLNRFTLKAGQSLPGHTHPENDEVYYILTGRAILTLATSSDVTETRDVGPDVAAFIPGGTFHRLQNPGDQDLVVLTIWPRMPKPGSNPVYDGRLEAWGTSFRLRPGRSATKEVDSA
jgi:mannose-6-phosphate isomerase-like protein (cupin superfamily)